MLASSTHSVRINVDSWLDEARKDAQRMRDDPDYAALRKWEKEYSQAIPQHVARKRRILGPLYDQQLQKSKPVPKPKPKEEPAKPNPASTPAKSKEEEEKGEKKEEQGKQKEKDGDKKEMEKEKEKGKEKAKGKGKKKEKPKEKEKTTPVPANASSEPYPLPNSAPSTTAPALTPPPAPATAPTPAPAPVSAAKKPTPVNSAKATPLPKQPAPPTFPCALCPEMSVEGLVRISNIGMTGKNKNKILFAHRICVTFTPTTWCALDPVTGQDMVYGFENIEKERWALKCGLCTEKHGTKVRLPRQGSFPMLSPC